MIRSDPLDKDTGRAMLSPSSKLVRWFFFCDVGQMTSAGSDYDTARDSSCSRCRIMCWAVVLTFWWSRTEMTILNIILMFAFIALLSFMVNLATTDSKTSKISMKGVLILLVAIGSISGLTFLTSDSTYLSYEFFVKKFMLKEHYLLTHWCPKTYVTVLTVTGITCVIRRLHTFWGKSVPAPHSSRQDVQ